MTFTTTGNDHTSFWDCYEQETYKRTAHRLTPDADTRKVEVFECEDCGRLFVCECFETPDGMDDDFNFYGCKSSATTESVLASYGIEQ